MLADLILLDGLDTQPVQTGGQHAEVFRRLELKYITPHCI
jgi:hypothetical protein